MKSFGPLGVPLSEDEKAQLEKLLAVRACASSLLTRVDNANRLERLHGIITKQTDAINTLTRSIYRKAATNNSSPKTYDMLPFPSEPLDYCPKKSPFPHELFLDTPTS